MMIRRAERVGPQPDDADWLVAHAAHDAATRIECAASAVTPTIVIDEASVVAKLEDPLRQLVHRLANEYSRSIGQGARLAFGIILGLIILSLAMLAAYQDGIRSSDAYRAGILSSQHHR